MENSEYILVEKRLKRILDQLEESQHIIRVAELSRILDVSEATIRRDLDKLQEAGLIERTHGGAIIVEVLPPEPPVIHRMKSNIIDKGNIGKTAAQLVHEGDTVFLGTGTTTLEVARNLVKMNNISVITNSKPIIDLFVSENAQGVTVIALGGMLRISELSFIGHIAENALRELRPQKVFMGIRAVSLTSGLTNDYLPEVSIDRVIIKSAPEIILVADHSKFEKVSTAFVAPVSCLSKIVTDENIDNEVIRRYEENGIEVILAKPDLHFD